MLPPRIWRKVRSISQPLCVIALNCAIQSGHSLCEGDLVPAELLDKILPLPLTDTDLFADAAKNADLYFTSPLNFDLIRSSVPTRFLKHLCNLFGNWRYEAKTFLVNSSSTPFGSVFNSFRECFSVCHYGCRSGHFSPIRSCVMQLI